MLSKILNKLPIGKIVGKKTIVGEVNSAMAIEPVLWAPVEDRVLTGESSQLPEMLYNLPIKPGALPGNGRIIAVQSTEGGAGATTVAINIAALLARAEPEQVALVDLDGFGAVRGRMGLPADQCLVSILDWLDIERTSEISRAMVAHSSGIMVVPGVLHYDQLSFVNPSLIFKLLSFLKERFKYTLLDCAPVGQSNKTWAAALVSDAIITVLKPTRISFDTLTDNQSYLNRLGCAERTQVIINQSGLPGSIKTADLLKEKTITEFYRILPYSFSVEEQANKREIIVLAKPRDDFARALRKLLDEGKEWFLNAGCPSELDRKLIKELAAEYGIYQPVDIADEAGSDNVYTFGNRVAGLRIEDYQRVRVFVQDELRRQFRPEDIKSTRDKTVRSKLRSIVARALVSCDVPLGQSAVEELVEELGNDCLGYGPIEPFFHDPDVTEIRAEAGIVRVEKKGRLKVAEGVAFRDEAHIRDVLDRMLAPTGRAINPNIPRVDATLHDGSRLKAHIPPVSPRGAMFSIRRFRQDMTIEKMISIGAMSHEIAEFLRAAVVAKQNIIVSGGTTTGKTTILNCIASFIPPEESIITIEDPPELQLQHPDVRSLEARPPNNEGRGRITMRELVQDALRMAPKRVIVGECRGGEAFEMLQAMNSGHEGSMTTGHANNAYLMTKRLIALLQMADMGLPYDAIVEQITYLDIIIQVVREKGGARRVDHICEINGVQRNSQDILEVNLNTLWAYNPERKAFDWVANEFARGNKLVEYGGWDNAVFGRGDDLVAAKLPISAVR